MQAQWNLLGRLEHLGSTVFLPELCFLLGEQSPQRHSLLKRRSSKFKTQAWGPLLQEGFVFLLVGWDASSLSLSALVTPQTQQEMKWFLSY